MLFSRASFLLISGLFGIIITDVAGIIEIKKGSEKMHRLSVILLVTIFLCFGILVFSQQITVAWFYNENSSFVIDEVSMSARIGYILMYSTNKFKVYANYIADFGTDVQISSLYIGGTQISLDSRRPTLIKNKQLFGEMNIKFGNFFELPNDFRVRLEFTFLPM